MQNQIIIRESNDSDIYEIAQLMVELGYPTTNEDMVERMKRIQLNADYKTIVAIYNNELAGMIGLIKNLFWERNGHYIKIQALVVKLSFRRKGIGELLIKSAEKWAKEIGAHSLSLNCGNKKERNEAHKFYPGVGFQLISSGYYKEI